MKKTTRDDSASAADGATRDQEVLRANRELAAYFKGLRTEREARAALKIIKGFIKHRERSDAARRRPLPGLESSSAPTHVATRKPKKAADPASRRARRHRHERVPKEHVEVEPVSATGDERQPEDSIERD